mmetsp:Transcript_9333/g.30852  ORF Transcript_9333/g.30852 Transcript_9333/m.30852 type:complete len:210 (-) Transcript_9333:279-908(-)
MKRRLRFLRRTRKRRRRQKSIISRSDCAATRLSRAIRKLRPSCDDARRRRAMTSRSLSWSRLLPPRCLSQRCERLPTTLPPKRQRRLNATRTSSPRPAHRPRRRRSRPSDASSRWHRRRKRRLPAVLCRAAVSSVDPSARFLDGRRSAARRSRTTRTTPLHSSTACWETSCRTRRSDSTKVRRRRGRGSDPPKRPPWTAGRRRFRASPP